MRDTKSLLLLLVSLLLVLVSFVLIWTWGYNFYAKNDAAKNNLKANPPDSASIANSIADSLQQEYTLSLKGLDRQLDSTLQYSDSLKNQLDVKLAEFYRLRNEIAVILKNQYSNNNFAVAKQKIGELQTKVDELKSKNLDIDNENKKLNEVLKQINGTEKNPDKNTTGGNSIKNIPAEKFNTVYSVFTVSDLRLDAVMNAGEQETETSLADKTEKFNGSFAVVTFNSQLTNAEIMVIVIKPDGKALKSSGWDSGTFNTPDGKKIYSYKFNFTCSRGEAKRLNFTLKSGTVPKGNYILEVYQAGSLIGRTIKTLN